MFKQGPDFYFDKRSNDISEIEITRVDCITLYIEKQTSWSKKYFVINQTSLVSAQT